MRAGLVRKIITRRGKSGTQQAAYWVRNDQPVSAFVRIPTNQTTLKQQGLRRESTPGANIKPADHVQVSTSWFGNNNDHVRAGLNVIGNVHEVPHNIPKVRVNIQVMEYGLWGYYKLGSGATREIGVNAYAPGPRMTVAHEYGHFLDHQLFGSGKPGLSGVATHSNNQEVKALMKVAAKSPEIKRLRAKLRDPMTPPHHAEYIAYLLMPAEIFARSYSQWVAQRSGDQSMRAELRDVRSTDRETHGYESQWSDANFYPLAREFDRLFAGRNLARGRST